MHISRSNIHIFNMAHVEGHRHPAIKGCKKHGVAEAKVYLEPPAAALTWVADKISPGPRWVPDCNSYSESSNKQVLEKMHVQRRAVISGKSRQGFFLEHLLSIPQLGVIFV